MERKNFIKNKEDFICDNCGYKVSGTGYTNHCPKCLYSKHVDDIPGDRANRCKGLMAPVGVMYKNGEYSISHKCLKCKTIKNNKISSSDDFNKIIELNQEYRV